MSHLGGVPSHIFLAICHYCHVYTFVCEGVEWNPPVRLWAHSALFHASMECLTAPRLGQRFPGITKVQVSQDANAI